MHFVYGLANGNTVKARRLYQEKFPGRRCPNRKTFVNIHRHLCDYGTFATRTGDRGRPRTTTPAEEEEILNTVDGNPEISTRQLAQQLSLSYSTIWKVLREQQLYPYHLQCVQALTPMDYPARIAFCQWFLEKCAAKPNFCAFVIFTDEAQFTRDGINNIHNQHVWGNENPHAIIQSRHQQRFSLNIWAGIVGDRLLGPHVLPNRLTGEEYERFLENNMPDFLDDVPLITRRQLHFMHDGAPPHFSTVTRMYLDRTFTGRWIGRGGPIAWPPRSPDLNPLDFYLWGHLKSLVYSSPVNDVDTLRNRLVAGCETIRSAPGIWERVRQSMSRRCEACITARGEQFEHLL